ncbi:PfkB family carbohydrate kinase [Paramicrobacterium chengjingii]|uniref:PfkB family carbohydrate kinase n=1 Tax=Paramicrobacterium chengjingii TaxID=2769067 RepID=UPI001FD31EB1|nr:PfkB family carbohydrate kinase [Microbacterium chengjingii]
MRTLQAETGTALIMVDADGENQIAVCESANAHVHTVDVEFPDGATVLAQLEISPETVTEAARRCHGYFALNAAPAVALPAELITRADLIIVNETEYALIPELTGAAVVAVTYGAKGSAVLERGEQVAFAPAVEPVPVNTVGGRRVLRRAHDCAARRTVL